MVEMDDFTCLVQIKNSVAMDSYCVTPTGACRHSTGKERHHKSQNIKVYLSNNEKWPGVSVW